MIVVRPSLKAALYPHARQDVDELLADLSGDGHDVVLQLPDPGQFSVQNSLESIGLFIAGNVSGTVLTLLVTDVHEAVRSWARSRFKKNPKAPAQYVTIYGPDNKPLLNVLARSADHIVDFRPSQTPPSDP